MRISCSRQAEAKSARGNHPGTSDTSGPSKLGRIPCQYAVLRTTVSLSLCRFIDGLKYKCRFIARILKGCIASSCKTKFWSKFVSLHRGKKILISKFVSLHLRLRWIRDCLIALSMPRKKKFGFFIASSREEILGRKNCIALFDLFSADSVSVSL